jgi:hypothetical protein
VPLICAGTQPDPTGCTAPRDTRRDRVPYCISFPGRPTQDEMRRRLRPWRGKQCARSKSSNSLAINGRGSRSTKKRASPCCGSRISNSCFLYARVSAGRLWTMAQVFNRTSHRQHDRIGVGRSLAPAGTATAVQQPWSTTSSSAIAFRRMVPRGFAGRLTILGCQVPKQDKSPERFSALGVCHPSHLGRGPGIESRRVSRQSARVRRTRQSDHRPLHKTATAGRYATMT